MIRNVRTGKRICAHAVIYQKTIDLMRGLMMKKRSEVQDKGYIFDIGYTEEAIIHSFFMRFPIWLIMLDKDKKVQEIKALKPWRVYISRKPCRYILEIEMKKDFYNLNIDVGDELFIS